MSNYFEIDKQAENSTIVAKLIIDKISKVYTEIMMVGDKRKFSL